MAPCTVYVLHSDPNKTLIDPSDTGKIFEFLFNAIFDVPRNIPVWIVKLCNSMLYIKLCYVNFIEKVHQISTNFIIIRA